MIEQKRDGYPNWVLDQLGIETMLANRVSLGPGLAPPRFLWVPFDDALLFPLDNRALAINSDRKAFFDDEDRLLARYLKECGYIRTARLARRISAKNRGPDARAAQARWRRRDQV